MHVGQKCQQLILIDMSAIFRGHSPCEQSKYDRYKERESVNLKEVGWMDGSNKHSTCTLEARMCVLCGKKNVNIDLLKVLSSSKCR